MAEKPPVTRKRDKIESNDRNRLLYVTIRIKELALERMKLQEERQRLVAKLKAAKSAAK